MKFVKQVNNYYGYNYSAFGKHTKVLKAFDAVRAKFPNIHVKFCPVLFKEFAYDCYNAETGDTIYEIKFCI